MPSEATKYILLGSFSIIAILGICFGYIASYLLLTVVAYLSPWLPIWMWFADIGLFLHAISVAACSTVGVIAVLANNSRGLKVCSYLLTALLLIEIVCTVQLGTRFDSLFGGISNDLGKTMRQSQSSYSLRLNDTQMWDEIQLEMNCCGVDSYSDWFDTAFGKGASVPDSCCLLVLPECGQNIKNKGTDPSDNIITEGCRTRILDRFNRDFDQFGYGIWLPTVICHAVLMVIIIYLRRIAEKPKKHTWPYTISDVDVHIGGSRYKLLSGSVI